MLPRSYLFVPGNRPERFGKALASGADVVILDLEDAVAADAKAEARAAVVQWAAELTAADRTQVMVRINDARSGDFDEDLRALREARLSQAMLPKAEAPEAVAAVLAAVPRAQVLALVESAQGVAHARRIAPTPGVTRLAFGTLDYALDLDLDISERPDGLAHGASELVLASRVAGLPAPVGGVTPQLDDEARLLADLAWDRRHGLGARLCIHPRQVATVHAALTPDSQAIAWARKVLAAEAASPGAARVDGRMIDRPVVLQAQRTLDRAHAAHSTP